MLTKGKCSLDQNTLEEHPVGFLRANRVMVGLKKYREAFCGSHAQAPKTKGAGITCPSL